jgi:AdoMet-dependent rRNA methyltransferase SPB1
MAKKQKSKARLDKYYYLAKEHGFRSRAAFKLIQLNKKYHFLENSTCLIDLCAAPGGWLQVAAKYMPVSSIKIGVDLDTIKPIHGVTTFQADITSEKCRFLIKKEIKHFKADIVLNDGAPNVGGTWNKDAYNQSELVLFSVKLATEFLKEGGWFITKVFRSSDYNSLMYVLKQLFGKVEATKPQASRNESAEIFVVCSGYKAPSFIDNKLLDPKFALKQLEDEEETKMNAIKSIKAMFDQKVNRQGYSGKLYNERPFKDFVEAANPYQFLAETNKIKLSTDKCKEYIKVMKCPIDYDLYFEDIQILGKKEVQELIIWRNKLRSKIYKKEKPEEEEKEPETEENYEEKKLEEMENDLASISKAKKKKLEQEKKKKEKNDLRMKMTFINDQENGQDDNGVEFDQGLFNLIRKEGINIEDLEYRDVDEEGKVKIPEQTVEEIDLSDLSQEDYYEMMNEDIEENMRLFDETKGQTRKKKQKKAKEERIRREFNKEEEDKGTIDDGIVYMKRDDKDEDMIDDEDALADGENQDEDEQDFEDGMDSDLGDVELEDVKRRKDSIDDYLDSDEEEIENPLRKKKNQSNDKPKTENKKPEEVDEEGNLSYDTDEEEKKFIGKKKKRENKKAFKEANEEKDDDNGIDIDVVPKDSDSENEYDTDEQAEIRAIAKKMLRKKDRLDILYKTYNRFAFSDLDQAPEWFADEERQHNVPSKPVTKDEINAQKEVLKQVNDRMPKKILEAKARKKKKLQKKFDKIKKKAQVISNQEEINEFSKIKQIQKLYKREIHRSKEKKKYVVARSNKVDTRKDTRTVKHVDKRLKKDKRALKRAEKRKKNKRR